MTRTGDLPRTARNTVYKTPGTAEISQGWLDWVHGSEIQKVSSQWDGWGSNPRPADYEKYGLLHWMRYLHGYHEVMPTMTPITPVAPTAHVGRGEPDIANRRATGS